MDPRGDEPATQEGTTTVGQSWEIRYVIEEAWEVRFLARAKRALEEDEPEIAVVMAATAGEVFVEQLFEQLLQARGMDRSTAHEVVLALQDRTLGSSATRDLLTHLSGLDVTKLSHWQRYRSHLTRRNNVVHGRDKTIPAAEAAKSIEAVERLWAEILEVVNAPGGPLARGDA